MNSCLMQLYLLENYSVAEINYSNCSVFFNKYLLLIKKKVSLQLKNRIFIYSKLSFQDNCL